MIEAVAIVAIICAAALTSRRWTLADRAASRAASAQAQKVLPLVELEAKVTQLEAKIQALAWRPK